MKRLVAAAFAMMTLSGCYVYDDAMPVGNYESQRKTKEDLELARIRYKSDCRNTKETACLAGQVVVAPSIYVEGREFFDAEAFGSSLLSIIELQDEKGDVIVPDNYTYVTEPVIENETFTRGFHLYMKGDHVVNTRAGDSGYFKINYLEEGMYDLRVQKQFLLKLTKKGEEVEPREGETPAPGKQEEKVYCVALYAQENGLELIAGEKAYRAVDDFKLAILDADCSKSATGATIIL